MDAAKILVDNAKISVKGQVTLPRDIRKKLGINAGGSVTFIYDGEKVIMMNPMHYAMRLLQDSAKGVAEATGLTSDDAVADFVSSMRYTNNSESVD